MVDVYGLRALRLYDYVKQWCGQSDVAWTTRRGQDVAACLLAAGASARVALRGHCVRAVRCKRGRDGCLKERAAFWPYA